MAMATERNRLAEIRRVEAAIRRIDADEYGCCAACGDEIGSRCATGAER